MACASNCMTQDHRSLGACLRAKSLGTLYVASGVDSADAKAFDAEIKAYRDATRQGIEPDGSRMPQIKAAVEWSEKHGTPYISTV